LTVMEYYNALERGRIWKVKARQFTVRLVLHGWIQEQSHKGDRRKPTSGQHAPTVSKTWVACYTRACGGKP